MLTDSRQENCGSVDRDPSTEGPMPLETVKLIAVVLIEAVCGLRFNQGRSSASWDQRTSAPVATDVARGC